jgi:RimJ/RimL family protein N-acetyltransferase
VPLRSGAVDVRRIEVGEGERLRALRLAALGDAPGAFGATYAEDAARPARHWEMLGGGPGAVFVGGDWDGMAGVYLDGDAPVLWGMWVASGARGRGLARTLAEAVVGWARDRGFERLRTSVSDAAPEAARLYERLGFARTGAAQPLESDPSLTQHELALALPRPDRRLETQRLLLRQFEPADLDALHAMRSREDAVRWLYEDPPTPEQDRARLERRMRNLRFGLSGDALGLAAVRRDDGTLVADLSLFLHSAEHRQGEIGFIVHPDHQGRGYATEAAGAVLALAFETFQLHRVAGRLEARNVASARVLEKLGMRREAHLVENELVKGEWQSEVIYAALRASRGA